MLFLRTYEGVMGIRVFREFQEFFSKENEKSSGLKLDRDNYSYNVIRVFNSHKLCLCTFLQQLLDGPVFTEEIVVILLVLKIKIENSHNVKDS